MAFGAELLMVVSVMAFGTELLMVVFGTQIFVGGIVCIAQRVRLC